MEKVWLWIKNKYYTPHTGLVLYGILSAAGLLLTRLAGGPQDPFLWLFPLLLLFPAAEDWNTWMISDAWSYAVVALGFVHGMLPFRQFLMSYMILIIFFGIINICCPKAYGGGDMFLSFAITFWLTPPAVLVFLWVSFALGLVVTSCLLLIKKKKFSGRIPFGPFLAMGGSIAYIWGEEITRMYLLWCETSGLPPY